MSVAEDTLQLEAAPLPSLFSAGAAQITAWGQLAKRPCTVGVTRAQACPRLRCLEVRMVPWDKEGVNVFAEGI